MTKLASDFGLIPEASKDQGDGMRHRAWPLFKQWMHGKQYGREALNQAWAFFRAGYDAAQRETPGHGEKPECWLSKCEHGGGATDEPFDDAIRILRSKLNETNTMRETLTSAQEAGTRLHNDMVKAMNELRDAQDRIDELTRELGVARRLADVAQHEHSLRYVRGLQETLKALGLTFHQGPLEEAIPRIVRETVESYDLLRSKCHELEKKVADFQLGKEWKSRPLRTSRPAGAHGKVNKKKRKRM